MQTDYSENVNMNEKEKGIYIFSVFAIKALWMEIARDLLL